MNMIDQYWKSANKKSLPEEVPACAIYKCPLEVS